MGAVGSAVPRGLALVGAVRLGHCLGAPRSAINHALSEPRHAATCIHVAPIEGLTKPGDSLGGEVPGDEARAFAPTLGGRLHRR